VPLGLQMLKKVAQQTVQWRSSNIFFGRIAIPFTMMQLEQISLIADIQSIVKETGCEIKDIEFEVCESTFSCENYTVYDNLLNIHKLGVPITIAGFGADIPVFHFIEPLGVEKFKVAQSYVQDVPGPLVGQAMIKSVMMLARELGVDVVSEVMDSNEQESFTHQNQSTLSQEHQPLPMKTSEATFYLRCHKKK